MQKLIHNFLPMENEGEILKNTLKGAGIEMNAVADKLKMTRQNLGHHFRNEPLNKKFREKLFLAYPNIFTNAKHGENKAENGKNFTSNSFSGNEGKYLKTVVDSHGKKIIQETPENITSIERYVDIPMYQFPGAASMVEMYHDEPEVQPIGQMRIPGAVAGSFALPIYGHSMYPTLENGNWCVLRPISDTNDIDYGEIYYIEYGDYRVYKRLLKVEDDEESVTLWSDNQSELVGGRPKYSAKKIKTERIRRLCLITDVLKKPNH